MTESREGINPKIQNVRVARNHGELNDVNGMFDISRGQVVAIGRYPNQDNPEIEGIPYGASLVGIDGRSLVNNNELSKVPRYAFLVEHKGDGIIEVTRPDRTSQVQIVVYNPGHRGKNGETKRVSLEPGQTIRVDKIPGHPIIDILSGSGKPLLRVNVWATLPDGTKQVRFQGSALMAPIASHKVDTE